MYLLATALSLESVRAKDSGCAERRFEGFDSRLKATVRVQFPPFGDRVVGFEVVNGKTLLATTNSLVVFDGRRLAKAAFAESVAGLSVDDRETAMVVAGGRRYRIGPNGPVALSTASVDAIANSGTAITAEAAVRTGQTRIALRRPDNQLQPLAVLQGALRAVSWNAIGLALVVDRELLAWPSGTQTVRRLATDTGFDRVEDAVLIGADRAVVALSQTLILISPPHRLVLGALKARVRWSEGKLFVLDQRSGQVFELSGIEQIGHGADDVSHARALVTQASAANLEDDWRFLEAARIVGCESARQMARSR